MTEEREENVEIFFPLFDQQKTSAMPSLWSHCVSVGWRKKMQNLQTRSTSTTKCYPVLLVELESFIKYFRSPEDKTTQ